MVLSKNYHNSNGSHSYPKFIREWLFFWLIFLVSSSPLMTTLRFQHFPSINTNFSKSSKLEVPNVIYINTYHNFYEQSPRFYVIHICFLSPVEKNVNQIALNKNKINHYLIESNSFLTGEFVFMLNTNWMRRNN